LLPAVPAEMETPVDMKLAVVEVVVSFTNHHLLFPTKLILSLLEPVYLIPTVKIQVFRYLLLLVEVRELMELELEVPEDLVVEVLIRALPVAQRLVDKETRVEVEEYQEAAEVEVPDKPATPAVRVWEAMDLHIP